MKNRGMWHQRYFYHHYQICASWSVILANYREAYTLFLICAIVLCPCYATPAMDFIDSTVQGRKEITSPIFDELYLIVPKPGLALYIQPFSLVNYERTKRTARNSDTYFANIGLFSTGYLPEFEDTLPAKITSFPTNHRQSPSAVREKRAGTNDSNISGAKRVTPKSRLSAVFAARRRTAAPSASALAQGRGLPDSIDSRHLPNTGPANVLATAREQSFPLSSSLCLGIEDIFIALFLILLILTTIMGNVLVVLSVFMYKRMRTFNNFLLTSLATADLLVGLLIMPLSLIDLLHNHHWPFGRLLCRIWATSDVMLCTASILNLCIISLDRYMAITSPLKYPRTRSRVMACGLLCFVWGIAMIVCSPPWFISEWGLFFNNPADTNVGGGKLLESETTGFVCAYSPSIPYRIYSALVSFYIPLMVMLSVYFKIFRVASERERLMRQGLGTCRLSRRVEKTQRKYKFYNNNINNNLNNNKKFATLNNNYHIRCASEPMSRIRDVQSAQQLQYPIPSPKMNANDTQGKIQSNSIACFQYNQNNESSSAYLSNSVSSVLPPNQLSTSYKNSPLCKNNNNTNKNNNSGFSPTASNSYFNVATPISPYRAASRRNFGTAGANSRTNYGITSRHHPIRKSQSSGAAFSAAAVARRQIDGASAVERTISSDSGAVNSTSISPAVDDPVNGIPKLQRELSSTIDNHRNTVNNYYCNKETNNNIPTEAMEYADCVELASSYDKPAKISYSSSNYVNSNHVAHSHCKTVVASIPMSNSNPSSFTNSKKFKITQILESGAQQQEQRQEQQHNPNKQQQRAEHMRQQSEQNERQSTQPQQQHLRNETPVNGSEMSSPVIFCSSSFSSSSSASASTSPASSFKRDSRYGHYSDKEKNRSGDAAAAIVTNSLNLQSAALQNVQNDFSREIRTEANSLNWRHSHHRKHCHSNDSCQKHHRRPNSNIQQQQQFGEQQEQQQQRQQQKMLWMSGNRLQPVNLLAKAQQHYQTNGPGKNIRGSKEKIVYLRERKALKTIGIVVLGFIICWMPFFVVYLVEVFINNVSASYTFKLINELFLWLGYSNSVLNPIIYTMYNGDFRRCFRDLLGFGCVQHHRRTMSVKKLHQQSTVF